MSVLISITNREGIGAPVVVPAMVRSELEFRIVFKSERELPVVAFNIIYVVKHIHIHVGCPIAEISNYSNTVKAVDVGESGPRHLMCVRIENYLVVAQGTLQSPMRLQSAISV